MLRLRFARWILLALVLCAVPASSYAGVFISVGFAPPPLPVYEQPLCPEPGLMWVPGYWAYGEDGYYWVPGAWVPAPYYGALWTPPYWGWSGGLYVFHPGYWGNEVGYYGGVNYGFGYFGIGFVGGMWRDHDFYYNRAVWHVDGGRFHHSYEDRRDWDRYSVSRDRHVSYNGGPGGIRHEPDQRERMVMREQHTGRTSFQTQHDMAARSDRGSYFRNNGGHPSNVVATRPLGGERSSMPNMRQGQQATFNNRGGADQGYQSNQRSMEQARSNHNYQNRQMQQGNPDSQSRSNYQQSAGYRNTQTQQYRQAPQNQHQNAPQYQHQNAPQYEQRQAPQYQHQNAPQYEQRSDVRLESGSQPQFRQQSRPDSGPRPAPREQHQPAPRGNPHR